MWGFQSAMRICDEKITIWNISHDMTSACLMGSFGKSFASGSRDASHHMIAPLSKIGTSPQV
jgi:hypothetical protein